MTYKAKCKLGDNILQMMKQSKITETKLSRRTGISRTSISEYINAHRTPNAERLGTIATCLGCTVKDLLKGIEMEEML